MDQTSLGEQFVTDTRQQLDASIGLIQHCLQNASPEDAQAILDLQRLAYRSEAELYGDDKLPPLTETVEQIRAEFGHRLILKAVDDGLIVGSVRAHQAGDACHIGRLIVHPDR
jgi:hypothetical protein